MYVEDIVEARNRVAVPTNVGSISIRRSTLRMETYRANSGIQCFSSTMTAKLKKLPW